MQNVVPTVGHHVLVELFGCDPSRTDDLVSVRESLLAAVRAIGATPVGEVFHRFSPQGVSGVVLIAESHLSCHTWPEAGYVAVDIYTCGDIDARKAVDHLRAVFAAATWVVQDVVRGLVDHAPLVPVERTTALYDRRRFHAPIVTDPGQRREMFRATGIVDVTGIVTPEAFARVRAEVLESTGDAGPFVREQYTSREVLDPLEQITGEVLHPCPEWFAVTKQHGWRWGEHRYVMGWVLEAPPTCGGWLQCVPHTSWNREDPRILEHLTEHPIETYGFGAGQIYLLKADTTLHRTVPLTGDGTRVLLNLAWASGDLAGTVL